MEQTLRTRNIKLVVAVIVMLFVGIIYAWSITKTPFEITVAGNIENDTQLGLNYTLSIIFFCLGGFAAGLISNQTSTALRFILSAFMLFTGYFSSSLMIVTIPYTENYFLLYMAYGMLGGLGTGLAFVTLVSTITAWFPDKRGFASGITLMGFGLSLLIVGRVVDLLGSSDSVGWRSTYVLIAIALGLILIIAAIIIKPPPRGALFPEVKPVEEKDIKRGERDYTALEMIKRPSFILIFIYITILAASGSAAISFAKDIAMDAGAGESLAVTSVGMLGVSNGAGRLVSGWLFDKLGIRQTQLISSAILIFAPLTIVVALAANSAIICFIGLCLCGFSYGFAPTTSSVFASEFYGVKNFALNFSIMGLILIPAPFAAILAGAVKTMTGGFILAFIILTILTIVGFFVSLAIKRP